MLSLLTEASCIRVANRGGASGQQTTTHYVISSPLEFLAGIFIAQVVEGP